MSGRVQLKEMIEGWVNNDGPEVSFAELAVQLKTLCPVLKTASHLASSVGKIGKTTLRKPHGSIHLQSKLDGGESSRRVCFGAI